jgi:hypothetical protein
MRVVSLAALLLIADLALGGRRGGGGLRTSGNFMLSGGNRAGHENCLRAYSKYTQQFHEKCMSKHFGFVKMSISD